MHDSMRCAFCIELDRIDLKHGDNDKAYIKAVGELFDRADRAARARRLYGKRKGHR